MAKIFREWSPEQNVMFPPSVLDLVPQGHLVHFIRNVVSEQLDLSEILGSYSEERGYPPQEEQAKLPLTERAERGAEHRRNLTTRVRYSSRLTRTGGRGTSARPLSCGARARSRCRRSHLPWEYLCQRGPRLRRAGKDFLPSLETPRHGHYHRICA